MSVAVVRVGAADEEQVRVGAVTPAESDTAPFRAPSPTTSSEVGTSTTYVGLEKEERPLKSALKPIQTDMPAEARQQKKSVRFQLQPETAASQTAETKPRSEPEAQGVSAHTPAQAVEEAEETPSPAPALSWREYGQRALSSITFGWVPPPRALV
ncbi:MAG: hypothetical protein MHM6MM_002423 [Cercozoa sp. M6MM]